MGPEGSLLMVRLAASLVVVSLALVCNACSQQAPEATAGANPPAVAAKPAAMSEQAFRDGMQVADVRQVVYKDENGSVISFDTFIASVSAGRSFAKVVEGDKSLAEFTINPPEAKPPATQHENAALTIPVASEMPEIKGSDISGNLHALKNGEHYTLLSFFFHDCVPCIQEIPQLNALSARAKQVRLVAVTFDDRATAERFVRERGLKLPVVAGEQEYIEALGIKTFPTLVLVSPDGRLVGSRTSYRAAANEEAGLKELEDWLSSFGVKS
jgi:thiol-disulfide isomerase/thioredoxin